MDDKKLILFLLDQLIKSEPISICDLMRNLKYDGLLSNEEYEYLDNRLDSVLRPSIIPIFLWPVDENGKKERIKLLKIQLGYE